MVSNDELREKWIDDISSIKFKTEETVRPVYITIDSGVDLFDRTIDYIIEISRQNVESILKSICEVDNIPLLPTGEIDYSEFQNNFNTGMDVFEYLFVEGMEDYIDYNDLTVN